MFCREGITPHLLQLDVVFSGTVGSVNVLSRLVVVYARVCSRHDGWTQLGSRAQQGMVSGVARDQNTFL